MRALDVWMNGELVGQWYVSDVGVPYFQYDTAWPSSAHARPISLSLPMTPGNAPHRGEPVANWFDNLLPDNADIRKRVAQRFGTRSTQPFDLLAAIGADCVGAAQLVPAGSAPADVRRFDAEPVDQARVARLLRDVTSTRAFGTAVQDTRPFRISIAGAQEKTALVRRDGQWYLPRGATPTTHILKLPLGLVGNLRHDLRDSVENEWLCMQLLGELGLRVAPTEIATFADEHGVEKVLVVERFDRQWQDGGWLLRLPQEDLCQANGKAPNVKYESDGGPGISATLAFLGQGDNPVADRLMFAKAQLAFWLLAAIDGHAKNFSIFLKRTAYSLTPLYDVLSAWPIIGRGPGKLPYQEATLAMSLRGTKRRYRDLGRIPMRAWRRLASETGVPDAFAELVALVHAAEPALDRLGSRLPTGFPEDVWTSIRAGVLRHRDEFLQKLDLEARVGASDDED